MSEDQEQQIIEKYLFMITPLEIKSNSKIKTNNRKSILIKLGNKTAKCTQLNTTIELDIEVLYSKTLQKYCPIKGIIKIYDVSEDGSEIISCVGGFQTDQLLNQAKSKVILQKEIGTSKLKMQINIVNKTNAKGQDSKSSVSQKKIESNGSALTQKSNKTETDKIGTVKSGLSSQFGSLSGSNLHTGVARRSPLLKIDGSKQIDLPFKNTSKSINKSLEKINQALSFKRLEESTISSKANEILVKAEVESIKQQLQEQKRKVVLLEDKVSKVNQKLAASKANIAYFHGEIKNYLQFFNKLIGSIEIVDGAPVLALDREQNLLCLKYCQTDAERVLQQFLSFILRKTQESIPVIDLDLDSIEMSRNMYEIEQNKKELLILKKLSVEKDKKIVSLEKQIEGAEITIRNLKETNKHLGEENRYMRDRNEQIQRSLYHKEAIIQSLQTKNEKISAQMQQVNKQLYNSTLEIDQLKEEVSNCMETIEKYRMKYGDLKNVKNRAIEMQIKECLRWIELQNRDIEMSEIQQTTHSQHEEDKGDSLSSVIRNIEIDKVPKEEMSIIRDELLKILQKVDQMMDN